MHPRLAILLVPLRVAVWALAARAQGVDQPTIKIGLNHQIVTGASYTLEDTAGTTSVSNSDTMTGTELFLEWLIFNRVGLELGASVTPLERTYELESGGTTVSEVTESAQLIVFGANLYLNRRTSRGFQYLIGVGGGTLTVSHEFKNGSLGNQSSSLTLPVTFIKVGVDYLIRGGGARLQFSSFTGSARDIDEISGYKQTLDYNLGILGLGVFIFF